MGRIGSAVWLCLAFYVIMRRDVASLSAFKIIEDGVIYLSLGILTARYADWAKRGCPNKFGIPQERKR